MLVNIAPKADILTPNAGKKRLGKRPSLFYLII